MWIKGLVGLFLLFVSNWLLGIFDFNFTESVLLFIKFFTFFILITGTILWVLLIPYSEFCSDNYHNYENLLNLITVNICFIALFIALNLQFEVRDQKVLFDRDRAFSVLIGLRILFSWCFFNNAFQNESVCLNIQRLRVFYTKCGISVIFILIASFYAFLFGFFNLSICLGLLALNEILQHVALHASMKKYYN